MVVSVGIDVSKDKHDCFILNSEGEILSDVFTIPNSLDGFTILLQRIRDCSSSQDNIKVGLEATGHYSYNILGFLLDNGLPTYVLNPLRTNLYRKSLSLRKTKTDRVDARTIAAMLLSDMDLKTYKHGKRLIFFPVVSIQNKTLSSKYNILFPIKFTYSHFLLVITFRSSVTALYLLKLVLPNKSILVKYKSPFFSSKTSEFARMRDISIFFFSCVIILYIPMH